MKCPRFNPMTHRICSLPEDSTQCGECGLDWKWPVGEQLEIDGEVLTIHEIRAGGFGLVYLGTSSDFGAVILKRPISEDLDDQESFKREAGIWVNLDRHPYIVKAYGVKKLGNFYFVEAERIDGGNLYKLLEEPTFPLAGKIEIMCKVVEGLRYAYDKLGLVHGDLKPDNVLLTKAGTPKITDFGLSNLVGKTGGGWGCMAPERVDRLGLDPYGITFPHWLEHKGEDKMRDMRCDIFSFGVILFLLITGKWPFSINPPEYLREIFDIRRPVPRPSSVNSSIPKDLDKLVVSCLQKRPGQRPDSHDFLIQGLKEIYTQLTGDEISFTSELNDMQRYYIKQVTPEVKSKYERFGWLSSGEVANKIADVPARIEIAKAQELNNKGVSLLELGQTEEALEYFECALAASPRFAPAWYNKGNLFLDKKEYQQALDCYDKAIEYSPLTGVVFGDKIGYMNNKALALYYLNRYNEAIKCIDEVLRIDPKFLNALALKHQILLKLNRIDEAVAVFGKFVTLASSPQARGSKARILYEQAKALLERGIEEEDEDE